MRGVDAINVIPNVADGMKVVLMIGDIRLREELVGVAGDVYVLDAAIATPVHFATHFSKFTPTLVKKFLICVQVCRLHEIRKYVKCKEIGIQINYKYLIKLKQF